MKPQPIVDVRHAIHVTIKYDGQKYYGTAHCHPEDMDFFSEKIGTHIAYLRAMINAMDWKQEESRSLVKNLETFYTNMLQNPKNITDEFCKVSQTSIDRAKHQFDYYRRKKKQYKKELQDYLTGHEKAITSIRNQRKKAAKTN